MQRLRRTLTYLLTYYRKQSVPGHPPCEEESESDEWYVHKTCISCYDNGVFTYMQFIRAVSYCVGAHSTLVRDVDCNVMMTMLQTQERRRLMDWQQVITAERRLWGVISSTASHTPCAAWSCVDIERFWHTQSYHVPRYACASCCKN